MTALVMYSKPDAIELYCPGGKKSLLSVSYAVADTRTMVGNSAVGCDQRDKVHCIRFERTSMEEVILGFDVLVSGCGAAPMCDKVIKVVDDVVYSIANTMPLGRGGDVRYAQHSLYTSLSNAYEKEMGELNRLASTTSKYLAAIDYQVVVTFGEYMVMFTQHGMVDFKKPYTISNEIKSPVMFFGGAARMQAKAAWNAYNRHTRFPSHFTPPAPVVTYSAELKDVLPALIMHLQSEYVDMFKVMAFSVFDAEPDAVGPNMSYYISVMLESKNTSLLMYGRTDGMPLTNADELFSDLDGAARLA